MKTIKTTYLGPTNHRGSRIKATDGGGHSFTIPCHYGLSGADVHAKAAIKLCKKMGWKGTLVSGSYKNDYYFNFIESDHYEINTGK